MKISSQYFLVVILTVVASCGSESVKTLTVEQCSQITADINKTVPQIINRFQTLDGVICGEQANNVYMIYSYTTDINTFKAQRASKYLETKRWCTNPNQKVVLERVSYVAKAYYDRFGKFLGELTFSRDDCMTV